MALLDLPGPGRSVNAVRTGPRGGTPVLLLHSAGLDLTYWDAQVAALGRDRDVVALDLPGHGLTRGAVQDWELGTVTSFVADAITALGGGPVDIVGLSVGGVLAQSLALTRPDLVRSLTLIDTAASFAEESRAVMRSRAARARQEGMAAVVPTLLDHWFTPRTVAQRPDLVDRATKTLLRDDPLVHAAMWEMIAAWEALAELHRVDRPTLVVVGELDATSPVASAHALRDGIRGADLRIVPDAAHLAPLDQPAAVSHHVSSFLAAVG